MRENCPVNTRALPTLAPEELDSAPDGRLLLLAPSANRVYSGDAARLNTAEITVLAKALGVEATVRPVTVAGVDYLAIEGDSPQLDRIVSEASGAFALFGAQSGALTPTRLDRRRIYTDDVITIQKYQGKTNEQFTHLLLNVTAAFTKRPQNLLDGTLHVLDPMCGRGTTLNTCLLRGIDVTGVDVDKADFEQYQAFITTWLRNHRLKHDVDTTQIRRDSVSYGRALMVEVAATKEAWKAGETQQVTFLNADTRKLPKFMKKASVDVIVADTPYGVQHGSHGERLDRSPSGLLERSLPGWIQTLRTGGAMGLAYNRHVVKPEELADVLSDAGLTVVYGAGVEDGPVEPDAFRHRVDASIDRDIVVARK